MIRKEHDNCGKILIEIEYDCDVGIYTSVYDSENDGYGGGEYYTDDSNEHRSKDSGEYHSDKET